MKLTDKIKEVPSGKGATPHTEKQAQQWAEYDAIVKAWRFPQALTYSLIEKLNKALTGIPRGIPLNVWLESIAYTNERIDLTRPIAFLRVDLARRLNK